MPVVVAPILIPMLGLLLCLFLWASSQAGQTFFRSLFGALLGAIRAIPLVGSIISKGIDWIIHRAVKPIADFALAMEKPVVAFFSHLASVIEAHAFAGYYTATRAWQALDVLRHVTIPRLLRAAVADLTVGTHAVGRAIDAVEGDLSRELARLRRYAKGIEADAAKAISAAEHALRHAVTGTLPQALPWAGRQAADAEAAAQKALKALRGIRNMLAAATLGALIVKALSRLGVGNIRCGNMRNIEKRLCGADPGGLASLLDALTLIVGTVSLVEFARACQTVEREVVDGTRYFLRLPSA